MHRVLHKKFSDTPGKETSSLSFGEIDHLKFINLSQNGQHQRKFPCKVKIMDNCYNSGAVQDTLVVTFINYQANPRHKIKQQFI